MSCKWYTKVVLALMAIAGIARCLDPDEEKAFCDFAKVSGCPFKAYCKDVCNYTGGWICGGYCGTGKNANHIVKIATTEINAEALAETFGDLVYLTEIKFSNSDLYVLPESFGNLMSLVNLTISKGSLRKLPSTFGRLSMLKSLTINDCKLSVLPESFNSLSGLLHLDLYGNRLASLSSGLFDRLTSLESLYLGENMLSSVPEYPSERIATSSSAYFLSNNYLTTDAYGPQHTCASSGSNQTLCASVLACTYDPVESECLPAASPNLEDDLLAYPAAPIVEDDLIVPPSSGSGSGSGSSQEEDEKEVLGEADALLYGGETYDGPESNTMLIVVCAVCGVAALAIIVGGAVFITTRVQNALRERRKSDFLTPEEQAREAEKARKRQEKQDAKRARKQAKLETKRQRQEQEQMRKERLHEIELEEREAVPMSVGAYFAEANDAVSAADVMLLSELGAGMLGPTYRAKITSHTSDGLVAAKLLGRGLLADPAAFASEARRLCALRDSPFLVQTFSLADPQDSPEYVNGTPELPGGGEASVATGCSSRCPRDCVMVLSEYVPAPNMRAFVWAGRPEMRPLFKLRMCADIARGLAYLHECGALHRNLKPENVLVVADDPAADVVCRLTGFATAGLAVKEVVMDFDCGMGTPQYLAPELMSGEVEDFTQMADVFSFAVVAFEAFREEAVYSENKFESNFALVRYVLSGKRPAANDRVTQDCPSDTLSLIAACWDQDPQQRPDLASVIAQLEKCAKIIAIDLFF